ncbi:MAG: sigma 54-interacting transcriptional regulator [Terriglobia bacterium]
MASRDLNPNTRRTEPFLGVGDWITTEGSRALEALRASWEAAEKLFEYSPDGTVASDSQGVIVRVSGQLEKMFGYNRHELIGQPIEILLPERFRDAHVSHREDYGQQARMRPMGAGLELYGRRKDGSEFPVDIMLSPLEGAGGWQVLGVVRDITERKQAEDALRESRERFRQIAENINEILYIRDLREGKFLYINHAYEKVLGRSRESLYENPTSWLEAMHPEDRERLSEKLANYYHDGSFDGEYRVLRPDGSIRWVWARAFPIHDASGAVVRTVGIAEDVTERRQAERALRESEQQIEAILDNSTAVIYLKDAVGRYLRVNREFESLFGVDRREVLGQSDDHLFPKDVADQFRANDRKVMQEGRPLEFEEVVPHQGGAHTYISIKFPLLDAAGVPYAVAGISTDITERKLAQESMLLEVTNTLVSHLDIRELLSSISASLRKAVPHDYACLTLYDSESGQLRLQTLTPPYDKDPFYEGTLLPVNGSPSGQAFSSRQPVVINLAERFPFPDRIGPRLKAEGFKSACWLPMMRSDRALGTLNLASRRESAFGPVEINLLGQLANQIAIAVDNALAYRQISGLFDRLVEEKRYLEDELKTEYNFEEIVGESSGLKRVLKQVETVAPTDATVLISGETGTGKELIARAIHNLSGRRDRTFVKLNCAAIPTGLLESELFGHEKGAFTGAISQKIGRLELAHRGTLFLDEVGDIPPEIQPKLLRALQEKEFERLGSTRTISVDVRLIAATNRDLARMVQERQFRSDLYYRLRVFPITVPPLRERSQDIPILAHYFAQKHAQRMNRRIENIPREALAALSKWAWPGNVRELENLIERAVILSTGPVLRVPLAELRSPEAIAMPDVGNGATLEDAEREHIMRILREAKGVIGGPNGAAARLGLKRTTLNSKMRKLGIGRRDI